jgi:hypothetical protein
LAGVSYATDKIDAGWLHSFAIICNTVGIVWLAKTIIIGVLKRIRPPRVFLVMRILSILGFLAFILNIGLSIHFVNGRKTANPVSVVLQNPFETARKHFFGAGKDDATDIQAELKESLEKAKEHEK